MGVINLARKYDLLSAAGYTGHRSTVLTDAAIAAALRRPLDRVYVLSDGTVPGLNLEVGRTGSATFWLNYRTQTGTRRRLRLGNAKAIPLDAARSLARDALASVARGGDPRADRDLARVRENQPEHFWKHIHGIFIAMARRPWKPKDGFVYVMLKPRAGLWKIGWSEFPDRRVKDLTASDRGHHDDKPVLIHVLRGTRSDEAKLHDALKLYRQHHEWFAIPAKVQELFVKHARQAMTAALSPPPLRPTAQLSLID